MITGSRVRSRTPLIWLVAALVFALDQGTKALVLGHIADERVRTVVPSLLEWVYVRNSRGAYGLFGDSPWLLIALSLGAFAVIWYSFRDRAARSSLTAVALGLVLGGAIGNILDRLTHGFVVDFIRIVPMPFFEVFNVADAAITAGIVLIVVTGARRTPPAEEAQP